MRLFSFIRRQTSRAIYWVLWPYLLYLVFYGCASNTYSSNVISRHLCPSLQLAVYPVWNIHVYPHMLWVDERWQVTSKLSANLRPLQESWYYFDEEHQITKTVGSAYTAAYSVAETMSGAISQIVGSHVECVTTWSNLFYQKNIHPSLLYYAAKYKYTLEAAVDSLCDYVKKCASKSVQHVCLGVCHGTSLYVAPILSEIGNTLSQYPAVQVLTSTSRSVYSHLLEQSSLISATLKQKEDFIRSEFYNLVGASDSKMAYFRDRNKISTAIEEILDEITVSEAAAVATEALVESGFEEEDTDSSEEDELPLTSTHTRTVFVTQAKTKPQATADFAAPGSSFDLLQTDLEEEEVMTYGSDSTQAQIDYELAYWQTRVLNTLEIVYKNLDDEFGPFLASKIEELRSAISANFSSLLQENFQRYKEMNELIVAIHKDAEFIRETNTTIDEPEIDRQLMRDKIAVGYEIPQQSMKDVEHHLNEAHVQVMTQYNKAAQETLDVLESMAETVILDFSSRLSSLLEVLKFNDDFDDAMIWSAWKTFHKVKETIFKFRDQIFDDANTYKFNARGSKVPRGLEPWAEYLGKVNFHISFLLRDNAEYLQLVRAKANVAYQEREGLTYKLEQLKKERREKQLKENQRLELEEQQKEETLQIEISKKVDLEKEVEISAQDADVEANAEANDVQTNEPGSILAHETPETQSSDDTNEIPRKESMLEGDENADSAVGEKNMFAALTGMQNSELSNTESTAAESVSTEMGGLPNFLDSEVEADIPEKKNDGAEEDMLGTEASEKNEFVQEAGEGKEMAGEREPEHDEL